MKQLCHMSTYIQLMFRYVQNGAKNRLSSKCNSSSFFYKIGVSIYDFGEHMR